MTSDGKSSHCLRQDELKTVAEQTKYQKKTLKN
jgi:hypothetical protein